MLKKHGSLIETRHNAWDIYYCRLVLRVPAARVPEAVPEPVADAGRGDRDQGPVPGHAAAGGRQMKGYTTGGAPATSRECCVGQC